MTPNTPLGKQMYDLAEKYPRYADELKAKADEFELAAEGYCQDDKSFPPKLLGAWARARRLYCDITGEPLIGTSTSEWPGVSLVI